MERKNKSHKKADTSDDHSWLFEEDKRRKENTKRILDINNTKSRNKSIRQSMNASKKSGKTT